jgi:transposase
MTMIVLPNMASLVKKTIKGKAYWYAVECKRVNGNPRIVWQKYLGRAEDIIRRSQQVAASAPQEVVLRQFGLVAAMLQVAEELDFIGIVDRHIPKREQGASIGQFMLLAALNRAAAPCSKLQIGQWYEETILPDLWKLPAESFSSQRFWDAMNAVSEEAMRAIERDLVQKLAARPVDLKALLYDTTNFATFIHTLNERNRIAQRGHAKSKRYDLRLVGLALLVTKAFGIPLFHRAYPGNVTDTQEFAAVLGELAARYGELQKSCADLTLVFDKGNNSTDNFTLLELEKLHFVASLVPSQHADLLDVPLKEYQELSAPQWAGVRAYRTRKEAFGQERTVVVTFSESFFSQQTQALATQMAKCAQKLETLAQELEAWRKAKSSKPKRYGKPPSQTNLERRVKTILAPQHMSALFSTQVGVDAKGLPTLSYRSHPEILQATIERVCGKTILFTDRADWSTEEIIAAYRGQASVEEAFRNMNNWDYLRWQPMYHWTDQKIRVHAFYCVMALMFVALLRKQVAQAGMDLSSHELLESLSKIVRTVLVYPPLEGSTKPRLVSTLSHRDPTQMALHRILGLQRFE